MTPIWNLKSIVLAVLCTTLISCHHTVRYSDLEAMGVNCPARDSCESYRHNLTYIERSCECDPLCAAYNDCCIDALHRPSSRPSTRRPTARTNIKCLHYGESQNTGIYVITKCRSTWTGPREIQEKCIGYAGNSDPLKSAPVTNADESVTYRNLYCAECNNANMGSLSTFQVRVSCDGLQELTEDQIWADITYNRRLDSWGVQRLNRFSNATEFVGCDIIYDVPMYLNTSVRFCRSNLISKCARYWSRPAIASACEEYMAVVYDNDHGYRNPHCAICNHKTVDDISCMTELFSRKRPMSFALLLDVNQSDGDQVGMRRVATPACPSGQKYDPFFKKCRQLVCALPGYVVENGKCVRG